MSIYSEISSNKTKTYVIMALFIIFVSMVIYVFSLYLGLPVDYWWFPILISTGITVGSYFYSDSIVLSVSGAKLLQNTPGQDVFDIVTNLSIAAGVPTPKIYLIEDPIPNAFATGRDPSHASICVTSGLLQTLNKSELEGVVAHELSHIKNFDTRLMVIVSVLVGSVSLLANILLRSRLDRIRGKNSGGIFLVLGLIFIILSPIVATLIQLAISRRREFLADASGALLTRYPTGLANALEKLEKFQNPDSPIASEATAHLYIVSPFGRKAKSFLTGLFQTHPPIEERVKILRAM